VRICIRALVFVNVVRTFDAVMGDSREQKFFPEISGNPGFLGIPGSFPVKFDVLLSLILFA